MSRVLEYFCLVAFALPSLASASANYIVYSPISLVGYKGHKIPAVIRYDKSTNSQYVNDYGQEITNCPQGLQCLRVSEWSFAIPADCKKIQAGWMYAGLTYNLIQSIRIGAGKSGDQVLIIEIDNKDGVAVGMINYSGKRGVVGFSFKVDSTDENKIEAYVLAGDVGIAGNRCSWGQSGKASIPKTGNGKGVRD